MLILLFFMKLCILLKILKNIVTIRLESFLSLASSCTFLWSSVSAGNVNVQSSLEATILDESKPQVRRL